MPWNASSPARGGPAQSQRQPASSSPAHVQQRPSRVGPLGPIQWISAQFDPAGPFSLIQPSPPPPDLGP
ncbi:hypothetical protein CDL15_Pgr023967 [Punica granatum]|uniref:Uncharacterized protein n=1 Tax=Punica granatum TaxID=22663 RepID=A0A218WU98_PUNGR|nr:hypothetical protein CDL15_Pgr023967 [Punica granatum]PKI53727.1 hypothetical protein CRG98_025857 [Punica granatum]